VTPLVPNLVVTKRGGKALGDPELLIEPPHEHDTDI
jgi:hypothetical protein